MSGCPALDLASDASLSTSLQAVDCQINYIVTAAYQRLFGSGGVFGAVLTSVLTIYVAFVAYGLLTGRTRASVAELAVSGDSQEIVSFDAALRRLEEESPDAARVVQLRFFAGLSIEQTADAMGVSDRTVNRLWTFSRAWLHRAIGDGERKE